MISEDYLELVGMHNRIMREEAAKRTKPFIDYAVDLASFASKRFNPIFLHGSVAKGEENPRDIDMIFFEDGSECDWNFKDQFYKKKSSLPLNLDIKYLNSDILNSERSFFKFLKENLKDLWDPLFYRNIFSYGMVFDKKRKIFTSEGKRIKIFRNLANSMERALVASG